MRRLLREVDETWGHFSVVESGKYLGVCLGPSAGEKSWEGPLRKWRDRTRELARRGLPVAAVVPLYRQRALIVLSYVRAACPCPFTLPSGLHMAAPRPSGARVGLGLARSWVDRVFGCGGCAEQGGQDPPDLGEVRGCVARHPGDAPVTPTRSWASDGLVLEGGVGGEHVGEWGARCGGRAAAGNVRGRLTAGFVRLGPRLLWRSALRAFSGYQKSVIPMELTSGNLPGFAR